MLRIPLINLSSHGGVRILVELANEFSREGFRVEILIPPGKSNSVYRVDDLVNVREIGVATGYKFIDYSIFLLILPFYLRGGVIIANFFVTYFPCRLGSLVWRESYIYFVQDIESKYTGLVGRILNFFCEISYRSKRIVTANSYLAFALKERRRHLYDTISIGPTEPFYKIPISNEKRPYRIMYMPRHEQWKRMDRFEEIYRFLPRLSPQEILCVGQDEDILERLARQGYAICRPKNDEELVECYDRTQVFLLTSDREGFGLPPLEAMARGVPVVSFRCGGPDFYIEDGKNSYLVDDVSQAVARICTLLDDTKNWSSLSSEARETAGQYRLARGLEKFVEIVQSELGRP